MKRRRFISSAIGLGAASLGLAWPRAADGAAELKPYSGADLAFGTTISIQVLHDDAHEATLAISDALAAAKNIDRLMTLYRTDSQVAILNRTGVLEQPDAHVLTVLMHALALSRLTQGAFDVTVQPLWLAYSSAAAKGKLPDNAERRAALALVDWQQLQVNARRISLQLPGMAITLNGIAQGYAVDVARATLRARGIRHAMLDTGEFGSLGRKHLQQPWTVAVRDPREAQSMAEVFSMDGRCMATSGDYEMTFSADFAQHHIFDPASGNSPGELASVTVFAPTGLQADGLSTALMVLGAEKAVALVATLQDVDVLLIDKDGHRWRSAHLPLA